MLSTVKRVVWIVLVMTLFIMLLPITADAANSEHDQGSCDDVDFTTNSEIKLHGGTYNTGAILHFLEIAEEAGLIKVRNQGDGEDDYDINLDGLYDFHLKQGDTYTFTLLYTCSVGIQQIISLSQEDINKFEAANIDELEFYSSMAFSFPEIDWRPGDISTGWDKLDFIYNGKVQEPKCDVRFYGVPLKEGFDYYVVRANSSKVGSYQMEVYTAGRFKEKLCSILYYRIRYKNTLVAKRRTARVSYARLRKRNQTVARKRIVSVSKAKGTVTYKKKKGNKKIRVASNGKVTVKRGLKKGTYRVWIQVRAAGTDTYAKKTKTVVSRIKVS